MDEFAFYRAVSPRLLQAALADREPGHALTEMANGAQATGPHADLADTHEALAYVLAGPHGDYLDVNNALIGAVMGRRHPVPEAPGVNMPGCVDEMSCALRGFDPQQLIHNFDPEAMNSEGVYPGGFHRAGWLEALHGAFTRLRGLYVEAAHRGWAVLVDID